MNRDRSEPNGGRKGASTSAPDTRTNIPPGVSPTDLTTGADRVPSVRVPEEPTNEEDPQVVASVSRMLDAIESARASHRRISNAGVGVNSVLAADDAATNPYQIGHLVGYCLMQAEDALHAIVGLVRSEEGYISLPVLALYPLIRSVIESSAQALWLMGPDSRKHRVTRLLQSRHDEFKYEKSLMQSVLDGMPQDTPQARSAVQREARAFAQTRRKRNRYLRRIAEANGITPGDYENQFPSWENIVRAGGEVAGWRNRASLAVALWKFASGLTHPSMSRSLLATEFQQIGEASENVLSGVLTTRAPLLVTALGGAVLLFKAADQRWGNGKIQVNGERPSPVVVLEE